MKSTISDLWNGNLAPSQHSRNHNPELQHLEQLLIRHRSELNATLPAPAQATLSCYYKCVTEYTALLTERAFCDGFSLGLKLLSEAFFDRDTPT